MAIAQQTYFFNNNQKLEAINDPSIAYHSNDNETTSMLFFDKDGNRHGNIYGAYDGAFFGLLDGDGSWSYLAAKDNYTVFKINNIEMMRIKADGNVGIGTKTPQHKLDVCGNIRAKEILVEEAWCDYVFEPEYCLTTLEEEAEFIKLYGHLSNFESAKAMDGMINVNDIFKRQQVQIEENVLHLIELKEENSSLQNEVTDLSMEVEHLTEKVNSLTANYKMLTKELAAIKAQLH